MADVNRSPGRSPRAAAGGAVRQRRAGGAAAGSSSSGGATRSRGAANSGGLWKFYTEDSTGLKIGPVPVLVLSLVFIASVFVLHIWGKYTRSH